MNEIAEPVTKTATLQDYAKMYLVIMHNDDFTPMDFVVDILTSIFKKNEAEANAIMMKIHKEEQAVVGIYTKEVAETKQEMTHQAAKNEGYPLKCTIEPEAPDLKIKFS